MGELFITKASGGTSTPSEMTVVPEPQAISIQELEELGREAQVNGVLLAYSLGAITAHERAAARFARVAAEQASTEELRELYEALGREHLAQVEVLTALMASIGLGPHYVGPAARLAEYQLEGETRVFLLAGSAGPGVLEIAQMHAALIMAQVGRATPRVIAALAEQAPPSAVREALQAAAERLATGGEAFGRIEAARDALLVASVLRGEATPGAPVP